jgi:hypothetical protein
MVNDMLTLKTSVAAAILAGTAAISAGASYVVTKATIQTRITVGCPTPSASTPERRGVPLGGPPLPTNQGKKW